MFRVYSHNRNYEPREQQQQKCKNTSLYYMAITSVCYNPNLDAYNFYAFCCCCYFHSCIAIWIEGGTKTSRFKWGIFKLVLPNERMFCGGRRLIKIDVKSKTWTSTRNEVGMETEKGREPIRWKKRRRIVLYIIRAGREKVSKAWEWQRRMRCGERWVR